MPFQPAPRIVEATINMQQTGVPVVNRFNVDVGHAVTHTDLTGVFAVIDAWITSDLAPSQVNQLFYDTIVVKDMSVANGEELIFVPTTTVGAVTTAPLPNSTAMVASLRTASTGRNYRGRSYLGGLPQLALQDATHAKVAYADSYLTIYENLIDALTTAGYKLSIVSRYLANALRAIAVVTEVISVIVNTKFDNQRRRTAN
jgi:hypothetical protein